MRAAAVSIGRPEGRALISHSRLLELLDYNCDSGIFTWLMPTSNRIAVGSPAGATCRGYLQIQLDGKIYRAHRLAWFYVFETWPLQVIDHIDGNPRNNAILNLRDTSQFENTRNLGLSTNNTSGFHGVSFVTKSKLWAAHIMVKGKSIYLGAFKTPEAASIARQKADAQHGFTIR